MCKHMQPYCKVLHKHFFKDRTSFKNRYHKGKKKITYI